MQQKNSATISVSPFGTTPQGQSVSLFTMANSKGMTIKVMNYGGIITSLMAPDKANNFGDIVLGYDSLQGYLDQNPYFGAIIGRYSNRIAKGKFSLDGKQYKLVTNNGPNHLHGGTTGFDKVIWNAEQHPAHDGVALKLSYLSKDMEEGYPGNLQVSVIYTLTNDNALHVDYKASTDKKTIINLTQHSYFNLTGGKRDILSHELLLDADKFVPVDQDLIPTGTLQDVTGTPFDFRELTAIGARIENDHQQLKFGKGYDHTWVLNGKEGLRHAATLYEPVTGRQIEVQTTEPGVQFYAGNFLDGSITGKNGTVYAFRSGLCLETHHFPDSPNQKHFPSVELNPGQTYTSRTLFKFSARR